MDERGRHQGDEAPGQRESSLEKEPQGQQEEELRRHVAADARGIHLRSQPEHHRGIERNQHQPDREKARQQPRPHAVEKRPSAIDRVELGERGEGVGESFEHGAGPHEPVARVPDIPFPVFQIQLMAFLYRYITL